MKTPFTWSETHLNPSKIAIIGGRKAGKTTLCASLYQSLIAASHGFSPNMITRFPDAAGLSQLEALFALKFSTNPQLFRAEGTAPLRKLKLTLDFTASSWSLLTKHKHLLTGAYAFEIDDLRDDFDLLGLMGSGPDKKAGESAKPNETSPLPVTNRDPLSHLKTSLLQANTLIICHPAGQLLAPSERIGFIRLLSDIGTGLYGPFETIIIAFTKYEQCFLKDGVKAFQKAVQPDTILRTIKETLNADHALEAGLRALNCHLEDAPALYAVPVSSFGFMRHSGAPNFDRLSNAPLSALAPRQEPARQDNPLKDAPLRERVAGFTVPKKEPNDTSAGVKVADEFEAPHPSKHWLPFLTADPFLTAISGMPSKFTIPFGKFLTALDHGMDSDEWRRSA